ncbi:IS1/IS1595 family N-terminal zinc-binding domain-containing protein [Olsenella uli]|uniref:IS1/IS1595 family N-terminal zinc-binding domain-containing protein n=1 Tax=Olsenella uli TaxID=133926 RepID=UPI003F7F71AF
MCGGTIKRDGKTKAGTRRWRCPACGASSVRRIDTRAKELGAFLRRLLSKRTTSELPGSRTSFRRRTSWVWGIWPIAHATGEVHDVVRLDGIWMRRDAVVVPSRFLRTFGQPLGPPRAATPPAASRPGSGGSPTRSRRRT